MRTALSARYTMIVPLPIGRDVDGNYVTCPSCPISSVQQSPLQLHRISFNSIVFGLRANPSTWKRLLDAGPPSQLEMTDELKQFIEFWGPKAHQRQFKDGRLQYCVCTYLFAKCKIRSFAYINSLDLALVLTQLSLIPQCGRHQNTAATSLPWTLRNMFCSDIVTLTHRM